MLIESAQAWIASYGAAALFALLVLGIVGVPVPDETLLALAGALIAAGRLSLWTAAPAALAGTLCGITLSYLLGRGCGRLLERHGRYVHLTPARLARAHAFFERFGKWALALGYFIPGVRHLGALAAGSTRLRFRTFAAFAYTSGAVWAATFLALGYFLQEKRDYLRTHLRLVLALAAGAAAIAVIGVGWRRWRRR